MDLATLSQGGRVPSSETKTACAPVTTEKDVKPLGRTGAGHMIDGRKQSVGYCTQIFSFENNAAATRRLFIGIFQNDTQAVQLDAGFSDVAQGQADFLADGAASNPHLQFWLSRILLREMLIEKTRIRSTITAVRSMAANPVTLSPNSIITIGKGRLPLSNVDDNLTEIGTPYVAGAYSAAVFTVPVAAVATDAFDMEFDIAGYGVVPMVDCE